MDCGVYLIRNTVTKKFYVGSSVEIQERWRVHKRKLHRGVHHSLKLQRSWKKHGRAAFKLEIVEIVADPNHLIEREQAWLEKTRAATTGYNMSPTAGSCRGIKRTFTKQHKQNISASKSGKNHPRFGKHCSAKTKQRISSAQKGKPKSVPRTLEHEQNRLMALRLRFQNRTPREIRKLCKQLDKARAARVYKPHSEATKERMRNAYAQRRLNEIHNATADQAGTSVAAYSSSNSLE